MKILFAAQRWEYGDQARGDSFEYANLYSALEAMPDVEVTLFDFMSVYQRGGEDAVRADLRDAVEGIQPDILFCFLFGHEIPQDILADLRDLRGVITVNWFADDHWRFEDFTRVYAPLFNYSTTTSRSALPKYSGIGYEPVILTQWGCNPVRYKPTGRPPRLDVSFVGQVYGTRRWTVDRLRRAGLDVHAWGYGWPDGVLEHNQMIKTFSETRVNLNLTSAYPSPRIPSVVRRLGERFFPPALEWLPGGRANQIKGRTFEIPGCGGMQLTGPADDLENFFEPGREIVLAEGTAELIENARRYLADEAARAAIAEAGLRRVLAHHTYEQRFRTIFREMGFTVTPRQ